MKANEKVDYETLKKYIDGTKKTLETEFDYPDGDVPDYEAEERDFCINAINAYNEFIIKFPPDSDVKRGFPLWGQVNDLMAGILDISGAIK